MAQLRSGYPRFVVHAFSRRLADHLAAARGIEGRRVWLASSARMARGLAASLGAAWPGADASLLADGPIHGVTHAGPPEAAVYAKLYLQNLGGFLSSREAEDRLVELDLLPGAQDERLFAGDAAAEVRRHLCGAFPGTAAADVLPAASGMNAVYAAFRAVVRTPGRARPHRWVQLGWLYLDTIAILRKFTAAPGTTSTWRDVLRPRRAGAALRRARRADRRGDGGDPDQSPDPDARRGRPRGALPQARRPSSSSIRRSSPPSASTVLPHRRPGRATSLTKYTGSEGDVIAGAVAVNPAGPDAAALRRRRGGCTSRRRIPATWPASPPRSGRYRAPSSPESRRRAPRSPRSSPRIRRVRTPTGRSSPPRGPIT